MKFDLEGMNGIEIDTVSLTITKGNDTLVPRERLRKLGVHDSLVDAGIREGQIPVFATGSGHKQRFWLSSVLRWLAVLRDRASVSADASQLLAGANSGDAPAEPENKGC